MSSSSKKDLLNKSSFGRAVQKPQSLLYQTGEGVRALAGGFSMPLDKLVSNSFQIRQEYTEASLQELADDIKERGILEPLIVRPLDGGKYEIIAGERRFRAARLAEQTEVPVVVKDLDDEQARFAMLIENIQREDLNPADERQFFLLLQNDYNYSVEDIAKLIHKARGYVRNRLENKLQSLQPAVQPEPDSEKSNELASQAILNKKSQSGLVGKTGSTSRSFVYTPRIYRRVISTLDDTLSYLAEQSPSPELRSQLSQDLQELRQKLEEIEKRLAGK